MRKFFILLLFLNFLQASNFELVKSALIQEFKHNFPQIIITKVDLKITSLPKDFEEYEFIKLAPGKFNRAQGFVRAEFKTHKNIAKNVFFRYFIKGNLQVLRASRAIKKNDKLSVLDYKIVMLDFDKVPANALNLEDSNNLISKTNISKNAILKENMFKSSALIKKHSKITGILQDENIDVLVELIALENANLNEKIRAKNKDGKVMQGVVISKDRILIE
ncbi:flagellar basal body P-ring formation protein FlgA [Campylobacter sp. LR291e]|uniref:flagellar basal body P-ring formation chaperone FlgA n=1 Tax=Campylobacter sp. LR291e TaxID=2593546 RepID=UPI00123A7C8E|nr:flagellar basal body P-ring formation chaperone FlgA [Campylobacter sp. LR291e]KAA6230279.1 flagellar basal body P-ring formation protein FlgA [Campylobacter sp. LR291e]